jgi:peptide deformylase
MAFLNICIEGNPILRQKAVPVKKITRKIQKLIKDMTQTMYEARGVGLAAPQIGISEQIVVIDVGDGPIALINPEISEAEGSERDVEGCLSIPGFNGYVTRASRVVVTGLNEKGQSVRYEGTGLLARAFQHEIDHLKGILFIDYIDNRSSRKEKSE